MFYLTTHSTHFIYGYMASDIWLRTILIVRKKTRCRHIGYSYRLTARVLYMYHPTDRIAHTTAFITPFFLLFVVVFLINNITCEFVFIVCLFFVFLFVCFLFVFMGGFFFSRVKRHQPSIVHWKHVRRIRVANHVIDRCPISM